MTPTVPVPGVQPWRAMLAEYAAFHREAVSCGDNDPVYPVWDRLRVRLGWDTETYLWACLVYVAYYHLGSALRVLEHHPRPTVPRAELLALPCATERRGHRDPTKLKAHLAGVVDAANTHGGLLAWLQSGGCAPDMDRWNNTDTRAAERTRLYRAAFNHFQTLRGNGRWAAYKLCDLLGSTLIPPLTPSDMGHAHSTGPREGLALLRAGLPTGNRTADIAELDAISGELCAYLAALEQDGPAVPASVAETTLCDFHALHGGRYYVGNDIDQMQAQLVRVLSALTDEAFLSRLDTLPVAYLGELSGWDRPDPDRRSHYRRTGEIIVRARGGADAVAPLPAP